MHNTEQPRKNGCQSKRDHRRYEGLAKEIKTDPESTHACVESKEPTLGEIESMVVHEEVPKEKTILKMVGALKKLHGDWYLDIGHNCKPKKRTQGNGRSQKKFAITC
jgi:hypothetical protein